MNRNLNTNQTTQYQCPHCGVLLETDQPISGTQVNCPECGRDFVARPLESMTRSVLRMLQKPFSRMTKRRLLFLVPVLAGILLLFGALGRKPRAGDAKNVTLPGGATMRMVCCPAGTFTMGGDSSDAEKPFLHVKLSQGFWMAETEVTQAQWKSVMGTTVGHQARKAKESERARGHWTMPELKGEGADYPMYYVSWEEAKEFCDRCTKAGVSLQLPTEAQWEYACRAGSTGKYGGTGLIDDMGWYGKEGFPAAFKNDTHPVGQKKANAWGLFDMHGNVQEWCADWYDERYYAKSPGKDPQGPDSGKSRTLRGGSCHWDASLCTSATRIAGRPDYRSSDVGFRPVRTRK